MVDSGVHGASGGFAHVRVVVAVDGWRFAAQLGRDLVELATHVGADPGQGRDDHDPNESGDKDLLEGSGTDLSSIKGCP